MLDQNFVSTAIRIIKSNNEVVYEIRQQMKLMDRALERCEDNSKSLINALQKEIKQ